MESIIAEQTYSQLKMSIKTTRYNRAVAGKLCHKLQICAGEGFPLGNKRVREEENKGRGICGCSWV